MTTLYYYFDASDDAASDPNNVWTNDANAFNTSETDYAAVSATGSKLSNYLHAGGTNAPGTGDAITRVNVRAQSWIDAGALSATFYTDGLAEELGTLVDSQTGSKHYSAEITLAVPAGGWTWPKIQALEARVYRSTGGGGSVWVYAVQAVVSAGPSLLRVTEGATLLDTVTGVTPIRLTEAGALLELRRIAKVKVTSGGVLVDTVLTPARPRIVIF